MILETNFYWLEISSSQKYILKDRVFEISNDPKYERFQRGLPSMFYKFIDKKSSSGNGVATD